MTITWNPSDKDPRLTLSNGNLTVEHTGTTGIYSSVRATEYKSSGKWYFEVNCNVITSHAFIGIATSAMLLDDYLGFDAYGWGYRKSGLKYHGSGGISFGAAWTTGDIIGVALDLDAGKIWWAKNNVWQASGDPAAGTNEAFSGISGEIYAAITVTIINDKMTGRFKSGDFSYTPPTEFDPYETEEAVAIRRGLNHLGTSTRTN